MSVSLTVSVTGAGDLAEQFAKVTGPKALQTLNEMMANRVREKIRDYIREEIVPTRHTTAEKLGAAPSKHMEDAVKAVEDASVDANSDQATITINHPGLGRAFHDVTITPHGDYPLTIPITAIAYAHRIGELRMQGHKLFRPLKKGAKAISHIPGEPVRFSDQDKMNVWAEKQDGGGLVDGLCPLPQRHTSTGPHAATRRPRPFNGSAPRRSRFFQPRHGRLDEKDMKTGLYKRGKNRPNSGGGAQSAHFRARGPLAGPCMGYAWAYDLRSNAADFEF